MVLGTQEKKIVFKRKFPEKFVRSAGDSAAVSAVAESVLLEVVVVEVVVLVVLVDAGSERPPMRAASAAMAAITMTRGIRTSSGAEVCKRDAMHAITTNGGQSASSPRLRKSTTDLATSLYLLNESIDTFTYRGCGQVGLSSA